MKIQNSECLRDRKQKLLHQYLHFEGIKELRSNIKNLDVRKGIDLEALISYNIQYIITINETYLPGGVNGWLLVRSLKHSESFEPVFITHHLLIWKVF